MNRFLASLMLAALAVQVLPAQTPISPNDDAAKAPSPGLKALEDSLSLVQAKRLLQLLNRGDLLSLGGLPGVGPVRAAAIQRSRPFASPLELLRVSGIGETTLSDILLHARSGFPK